VLKEQRLSLGAKANLILKEGEPYDF